MRAAPAQEDDGLEQAGLACGVGPDDEVGARPERRLEAGVPAQVERDDRVEQVRVPAAYDVVRTGMTTCT
jgi:hypothetical protein